jgi:hypothetical protein
MPTFTQAQRTGTEGQLEVRLILQRELQFLPHPVAQEYDTGIDIIAEASHTGQGGRLHPEAKFIGVQVKSGESYFRTKTETGWVYAEDAAELDHWLSSSLPIVLVLHQAQVGAWWVEVTESAARREGSRFRIEVPNSQPLTADARDALRSIANGEPRLVSRWDSGGSRLELRLPRGGSEVLLDGQLLVVEWSYEVLAVGATGGECWRVGRSGAHFGIVLHEYEHDSDDDERESISGASVWLIPPGVASFPQPLINRPLAWVHEALLNDLRPTRVRSECWNRRVPGTNWSTTYGAQPRLISPTDLPASFVIKLEQLFRFQWLGLRSRRGVSMAWAAHQSLTGRSMGVDVIGLDLYAAGLRLVSESGSVAEFVVTSEPVVEGDDSPLKLSSTAVMYFRELANEERVASADDDRFPEDGFAIDIPRGFR